MAQHGFFTLFIIPNCDDELRALAEAITDLDSPIWKCLAAHTVHEKFFI